MNVAIRIHILGLPGALAVLALSLSGCGNVRDPFVNGLHLNRPITDLKPDSNVVRHLRRASLEYEVADDEHASHNDDNDASTNELASATLSKQRPPYDNPVSDDQLQDLTLKGCIVLAVHHNRDLRRRTHAAERIGLEQDVARSELDGARLEANFSAREREDIGDARVGIVGRTAGFEIEPFVLFDYDEADDDEKRTTTYGVAVSRNVFRINHETMRQHLPLTRATRDFHIAINNRILELRDLHFRVVELFYNIQRLKQTVAVRQNRVDDAEQFLRDVSIEQQQGMKPAVDVTNARINLNQAQTDLVREQTNLRNTNEALLDLLGLDLGHKITIVDNDLTDIEPGRINLQEDIDLVRNSHERVRNQLIIMEVQRQIFQISRDELIPDLDVTFTASRDSETNDERVQLDLNLSVPLDGYRAEKARATQNRLRLMESAVEMADIRSDLDRELRRSFRNINQLGTTVRLNEERVEAEGAKLKSTMLQYDSGAIGNLEVTRAKEAFDSAKVDLLASRIARIVEEARYRSNLPAPPADASPAPTQTTTDQPPAQDQPER